MTCGGAGAGRIFTHAALFRHYDATVDAYRPAPGSLVIDAADDSVGAQFNRDQLGAPRNDGNGDGTVVSDVGAIEAPAAVPQAAVTGFVLVEPGPTPTSRRWPMGPHSTRPTCHPSYRSERPPTPHRSAVSASNSTARSCTPRTSLRTRSVVTSMVTTHLSRSRRAPIS